MEIGAKTLIAGAGLFLLGVGSTYWLMADNQAPAAAEKPTAAHHQPAMQAALNQLGNSATETPTQEPAAALTEAGNPHTAAASDAETETASETETLTHESFLAAAEARREQQLADKAETERLDKLRQQKADSVDCKFWRQQQASSSTAAKIEEKIKTFCFIAQDLASSESSSSDAITP
ncbi:hypothetical protein [Cellvibrio fontiphilus]|uniref:Uncharacterized protein n=1 Tax=Cellvibrio fontiphilus TaxID=1815559 RepID=A0ABV7FED4_9GAMM